MKLTELIFEILKPWTFISSIGMVLCGIIYLVEFVF